MIGQYVSSWVLSDSEGETFAEPALFVAHPQPLGMWWQDVTGTADVPPDPNLVVVQVGSFAWADPAAVAAWVSAVTGDPETLEVWRE